MLKYSLYAVLVGSLCAALSLDGGDPKGLIKGTLRDSSNQQAIPYVIVQLKGGNSTVRTGTCNAQGQFRIQALEAGNYLVEVQFAGFKKLSKHVSLAENDSLNLDLFLPPSTTALQEIITEQPGLIVNLLPSACYNSSGASSYDWSMRSSEFYCKKSRVMADKLYNTENYSHQDDNDFKESKKEPLSTFSIDVDKASYSNIRRFITQGNLPPADAVRVEEMINYFTYDYSPPSNTDPFSISQVYTDCPWNKSHQLIRVGIQGQKIKTDHMKPNNLVFLVDVSGSMMSPDKLPLLKSGLSLLVDQMRPMDRISIVVYAGAAGQVLEPTAGDKKDLIKASLEQLEAGGSTAGGEGIKLAYKVARKSFISEGNNRVILATDGDFNVGVSSDGELVRIIEKERESGVFLTLLGFGTGNLQDSKMEQLADKGNGNYAYIDNILEAKKVLVKEMGGTIVTIAKDVKIQVEFNPAKVKAYRLVGYENRLLNNEDFNDDKKDAGELGSGHQVTALYEIIPAGSSETLASVDPLKYQSVQNSTASASEEIMTIKFRYKEPNGAASKLITKVLLDKKVPFAKTDEDLKFAAAVSEFGMLLRDSKYKGESSYNGVINLARQSKGADEEGYRSEFIRLVEMAELLNNKVAVREEQ